MKNKFYRIFVYIVMICNIVGVWIPSSVGIEKANISIADILETDFDALYSDYYPPKIPTEPYYKEVELSQLIQRASSGSPNAENDIITLMNMNSSGAANGLYKLAQNTNRYVSGTAIWALGNIDGNLSVPLMIQLLDSESVILEFKAVLITNLGKYPCQAVEDALIQQLQSKDLEHYVLSALGDVGTKKSVDILVQYSEYGKGDSKSIAANSLKHVEMRMNSNTINQANVSPYIVQTNNFAERSHYEQETVQKDHHSTKATNELRAHIMKQISRIRKIEEKMNETQEQVMKVDAIIYALKDYNNMLKDKMEEIAQREGWSLDPPLNIQSEYHLKQMAMKDSKLQEIALELRSMMLDKAYQIEPTIHELESELIALVKEVIDLQARDKQLESEE